MSLSVPFQRELGVAYTIAIDLPWRNTDIEITPGEISPERVAPLDRNRRLGVGLAPMERLAEGGLAREGKPPIPGAEAVVPAPLALRRLSFGDPVAGGRTPRRRKLGG